MEKEIYIVADIFLDMETNIPIGVYFHRWTLGDGRNKCIDSIFPELKNNFEFFQEKTIIDNLAFVEEEVKFRTKILIDMKKRGYTGD